MTEVYGDDASEVLNYVDPNHVNAVIPLICNHKECRTHWQFCSHDHKTEGYVKMLKEEKMRKNPRVPLNNPLRL